MPVATGAYVVKNCSVKFATVEYANQHTKAQIVPDTSVVTQKTLDPTGTLQDVDTPTYAFEVSGLQGDTLWTEINNHAGEHLEVVFQPKPGGTIATFTIVAMALAFGDEQGKFAAFDASFPVVGVPVYSEPESS